MISLVAADAATKVWGIDVTLLAAGVAAVAAIAAAGLSYRGNLATNRAAEAQRQRDYRVRQLNELYGPLYMRRRLSRQLWKQLPGVPDAEPGVTQWHLIDHVEEIKTEQDAHRRQVVEEILKINDELTGLITGSAGLLVEFPAPQSFETFLVHAATLRMFWEQGRNATKAAYIPFPGSIDRDIEDAITRLRSQL
ncbi:MAG TPA: hypothetical protein VG899_13720 [Mycobacteriales bacterium]|nr:hypothetical protein [Mycobacteriales bacterium]